MKYETKILSLVVKPVGGPIFSEQATVISIDDEAAGEFLKLTQHKGRMGSGEEEVCFNFEEWKTINDAVNKLIGIWSK